MVPIVDKLERQALRYGLHHPEKACFLGMTIIAVTLILHILKIIPEFDGFHGKHGVVQSVVQPVPAEKGR